MKKTGEIGTLAIVLMFVFMCSAQARAQSSTQTLKQYISDLQNNPNDTVLREKIIKLVQGMKKKPAIPEKARQHFIEAGVLLKAAKDQKGQGLALDAYRQCLLIAPWWSDAYYNYGIALELANQFDDAINALNLYITTKPGKEESRKAQDKIHDIDTKAKLASQEAEEQKQKEAEELQAKIAEMVYIPAGWFWMGCSPKDNKCQDDEKPAHRIFLDAYYIDKYPVTNELYKVYCDAMNLKYPAYWETWLFNRQDLPDNVKKYPVVSIDWNQATAYCQWAGKKLPTEAQWEKAARGTDGRIYPWGNEWDASKACFNQSSTCAVGSYPQGASPYGVLDMAGNVYDWCADWYDAKYYSSSPDHNPTGPDSGQYRVLRGGSWVNNKDYSTILRSSYRGYDDPSDGYDDNGFRCVR